MMLSGAQPGTGSPGAPLDFDDAGVVLIYSEFRAAGQHAIAFDAVDYFSCPTGAHTVVKPGRQLGAPQDNCLAAQRAKVHDGLDIVAGADRLAPFPRVR